MHAIAILRMWTRLRTRRTSDLQAVAVILLNAHDEDTASIGANDSLNSYVYDDDPDDEGDDKAMMTTMRRRRKTTTTMIMMMRMKPSIPVLVVVSCVASGEASGEQSAAK
jgi:hypothetical protein